MGWIGLARIGWNWIVHYTNETSTAPSIQVAGFRSKANPIPAETRIGTNKIWCIPPDGLRRPPAPPHFPHTLPPPHIPPSPRPTPTGNGGEGRGTTGKYRARWGLHRPQPTSPHTAKGLPGTENQAPVNNGRAGDSDESQILVDTFFRLKQTHGRIHQAGFCNENTLVDTVFHLKRAHCRIRQAGFCNENTLVDTYFRCKTNGFWNFVEKRGTWWIRFSPQNRHMHVFTWIFGEGRNANGRFGGWRHWSIRLPGPIQFILRISRKLQIRPPAPTPRPRPPPHPKTKSNTKSN